jgi:hypothetical protein
MSNEQEYYCIFLMRYNDRRWFPLIQFDSHQQAEREMTTMVKRNSQRYSKANLRVLSRTQAKREFGSEWEYTYPIQP